jgi:hypothetical protein
MRQRLVADENKAVLKVYWLNMFNLTRDKMYSLHHNTICYYKKYNNILYYGIGRVGK